jgi:peptide/nickel transport system substrate-binding protein
MAADVPQFSIKLGPDYSKIVNHLVNVNLAKVDHQDNIHPYLLERLPSHDDGSWTVNADGTMRTTLRLRSGISWHDGQPLTAHDIAFAYRVYADPEIPSQQPIERIIDSVVPRDDRTAEVNWREPHFRAGAPEERDLVPLPRHLLESLYGRDKQAFMNSPFWTSEEYVSAGPYRVQDRDLGVGVTLSANPAFFLGKPQIETVRLEIVLDKNAIIARLLSGTVDFTEDITPEQAAVLREQWQGAGVVYVSFYAVQSVRPQFRDVPNHQPALRDVRVRRAMMHAVDRDAVAAAMTSGLSTAADTYYSRENRLYPRVEQAIAKYPYDVRRAESLMAEAGWSRSTDGGLHDGTGRGFELECTGSAARFDTCVPMIDYWKRIGIDGRAVPLPQVRDPELTASFPGVQIDGGQPGPTNVVTMSSVEVPTAQNRWSGRNAGSYLNPELDNLLFRVGTSLNPSERDDLMIEVERAMSLELPKGAIFYATPVAAGAAHIKGIKGYGVGGTPSYSYNGWEWNIE